MPAYGVPDSTEYEANVTGGKYPGAILIGPGLHLPNRGRVWALDTFAGKPELIHIQYSTVELNNHTGSNLLKVQAAPLIYKPKKTIELKGPASAVKIHSTLPTIFVRGLGVSGDRDDFERTSGSIPLGVHLVLVKLDVRSDRRVAATVEFTQITSTAVRSENAIEVVIEKLPGIDCYKITPKQPLAPGEYGLMQVPKAQNLFNSAVYDFAIDPSAPEAGNPVKTDSDAIR